MNHPKPPKLGELSTKPAAVQSRIYRLHNDDSAKRHAYTSKRRGTKMIKDLMGCMPNTMRHPYWASRVRFHLSRGRDAADIVVRENIPASIVTKLIEEIHASQ